VKNGKNLASKQKDLANMYKGFILDKLFAPLLVPHYEGKKKNLAIYRHYVVACHPQI